MADVFSNQQPSGKPKNRQSARNEKLEVLIADDSAVCRRVLQRQLGQLSLHCALASGGLEVLAAIKGKEFAAVLLDWNMPDLGGLETTRQIRQLGFSKSALPVIGISAETSSEIEAVALVGGMNALLNKPVSVDDLRVVLESHVDLDLPSPPKKSKSKVTAPPQSQHMILSDKIQRPESLVQLFLQLVPVELEKIQQAIQSQQYEKLKLLSHKLKGSCLAFGASAMAATCLSLEQEKGSIDEVFCQLRQDYQKIVAKIAPTPEPGSYEGAFHAASSQSGEFSSVE